MYNNLYFDENIKNDKLAQHYFILIELKFKPFKKKIKLNYFKQDSISQVSQNLFIQIIENSVDI